MRKFINLTIQKSEERLVEGFASTELPDDQGGYFQGRRYADDVVQKYEAQPTSGGPVLRKVADKALPPGVSAETPASEPPVTETSLADLRKATALEPNPMIRAGLLNQLKDAEAAYRARN